MHNEKESTNDLTLKAYNAGAQAYVERTPMEYTAAHAPLISWIDSTLLHAPKNSRILEIGSAMPREAHYMRSRGFTVTTSDAAEKFVDFLRSQGEDAKLLNILKDPLGEDFDVVFANAVVQHFTPEELMFTLRKVFDALPHGGLFSFSTKQGAGEAWINEKMEMKRFVHYWQPKDLYQTVEAAGYKLLYTESDVLGDLPGHVLIRVIAQKP